MGFTLNGIHTDTFLLCTSEKQVPLIPEKKQTVVEVQGRDGQYVFEGAYNNEIFEYSCVIGGYEMLDRRKIAREIAEWLSKPGILIPDSEPDIEYTVISSVNNISTSVYAREFHDDFDVSFVCEPHPKQKYYNNDLTWDDIDSAWPYTSIPWNGYDRNFTVTAGQTIDVENAGTYKALPIIKMVGVASSISFGGCTYTNLSGTVYIDCKNMVVYSLNGASKVNCISNFSGEFPELKPGSNKFTITGSITNLTLEFDYRNTYL